MKLIIDCHQLLNDHGMLYLSFVAGDYKNSGYQEGSSGNRTYFYYHSLEKIVKILEKKCFTISKLMTVNYTASPGKQEKHTVIIAKKTPKNDGAVL